MVMTKPACVLSLFLFAFFGSLTQGIAYEGGPIRAEVVGYDPTESKLFYRLVFHDETDDATQVYYLHLTGRDPARAIRARSLEHPYKSEIIPEVTSRWQQVSNRLVPLNEILEVKPALHVKAKGAGTDSSHQNVPRYKITVGSECWSEKSRGPVYRVLQAAGKGTNSVSDTGPTRTIIGTVVHRSGVWLRGGRKSHTPIGGRPVTLTLGGFGFKREALC